MESVLLDHHKPRPKSNPFQFGRYNIPELAKKHKVYALDLLGFGWSDKALVDYNAALWRDQVADFIREKAGGGPVVLAGNR